MATFEREEAEKILHAVKSAAGAELELKSYENPAGEVLRTEGKIVVTCLGHDLMMWAREFAPDDRQVMLVTARTDRVLFRLCHNKNHETDIHWHYFEGACKGGEERVSVPNLDLSMSLADLVIEVFVPTMQIKDLVHQGVML